MVAPFNPVVMPNNYIAQCKRFVPSADKSILCRICHGPFFQHTPQARRFDSVFEMHRAYMSDQAILSWLFNQSRSLDGQIEVIKGILYQGKQSSGAPETGTLHAVLSCLEQLVIERDKGHDFKRCYACKNPLEEGEEDVCVSCISMAAEGGPAAEGACAIQDLRAAGTHDVEGTPGTVLPEATPD